MIKQSNLLKWAHNSRNNSKNGNNKSWIHPPEALQHGHVAYLVKFLGNIEVDQAKGIEVVKNGIRKLKFNQQLRKAEGTKTPKVEITISIDGVAIQDQKTKQIYHQYPLHRISYCANDKSDKKFFSFIAKEETGDKHSCFVFASDKLAEDITLTIGEAFDLAYRKFLDTSGKDLETKKQLMILQKKVQELEKENSVLKQKLAQYTKENLIKNGNFENNNSQNLLQLNGDGLSRRHQSAVESNYASVQKNTRKDLTKSMPTSASEELFNLVSLNTAPSVGRQLENLCLDDLEDFNPREDNHVTNGKKAKCAETDIFGAPPFNPQPNDNLDPFGMPPMDFQSMAAHGLDLENAIGELDKTISEMRAGFQRGISFGNEDFFDSAEIH